MIQYSRVHDCVSYRCHSSSATQPIESGNFRHFSARYACVALHDFYFTHMSSAMRCVCDASCHWQNGTFEHWGIRHIIILLILSITFLCNFQERRRRQQQRWMWMNIKHLLTIRVFLAIPFLLLFIIFLLLAIRFNGCRARSHSTLSHGMKLFVIYYGHIFDQMVDSNFRYGIKMGIMVLRMAAKNLISIFDNVNVKTANIKLHFAICFYFYCIFFFCSWLYISIECESCNDSTNRHSEFNDRMLRTLHIIMKLKTIEIITDNDVGNWSEVSIYSIKWCQNDFTKLSIIAIFAESAGRFHSNDNSICKLQLCCYQSHSFVMNNNNCGMHFLEWNEETQFLLNW